MLLDGFSSMPCKEVSPPTALDKEAPQELPWMWSCQGARTPPGLVSDAAAWAWAKGQVQWGKGGRNTWDGTLLRGRCSWGNGKKIGH